MRTVGEPRKPLVYSKLDMKKLYTIRIFVMADSPREAMRLAKERREPDEVYISDDWFKEVGFIKKEEPVVKGFNNKKG